MKHIGKILSILLITGVFMIFAIPIFLVCCGIVLVLAKMLGFTYEEMNTFLFLYGQPIILTVVCACAVVYSLFKLIQKFSWERFVGSVFYTGLLAAHLHLTAKIANRYWYWVIDAHNACILAYRDLEYLGKITSLGYIWVNLILFIILFLAIFILNIAPFRILRNTSEKFNLKKRIFYYVSPIIFSLLFTGVFSYYKKEILKEKPRSSKEELKEFNKKYNIGNITNFFIQGFLEGDKRQMEENN